MTADDPRPAGEACRTVLRRIAAGEPNPAQIAADLLEAHGHEGINR